MDTVQRRYIFLPTILFMLILVMASGCTIKMRSATIGPEIQTFYVGRFKQTAYHAPAILFQTFQEALKDKVSMESRLAYTEEDPDVEFNGTITGFTVTEVAPQPGETVSFNRLTIQVSVEYTNHHNSKNGWTRTFSFFADFGVRDNLLQVQDQLIEEIFDQILEDIFNQAFNNW